MAAPLRRKATIEDLYNVPEGYGAELVDGEIVLMSPTGLLPNNAAGAIYASLRDYARRTGLGRAYTDGAGFEVRLPDRSSFSPDAAFYLNRAMSADFGQGAPAFAVEVRSKNDYGRKADKLLAQKCADYFAAGTQVVWIVDVLRGPDIVKVYRAGDVTPPTIYRRGYTAEAEPAEPGWSIPVDELFE